MRVLIVDDHPLMRGALRGALEAVMEVIEVDLAGSLEEAFGRSFEVAHDLVLLDLNLPDARGSATIGAYCRRLPDRRVMAMSADDDQRTILACRHAGAVGFLSKGYDMRRTVGTIFKVLGGESGFPLPPDLAADSAAGGLDGGLWPLAAGPAFGIDSCSVHLSSDLSQDLRQTALPLRSAALAPALAVGTPHPDGRHLGLTERQRAVLRLMLRGLPNKLICRELALAEGTVKVHVSAVLRALNVANRSQAVVAANRAGIRFD